MELIGGKSLKINSRAKMDRPMMAWADDINVLPLHQRIIFGIFLSIILILALIGNILTLYANFKKSNKKRLLLRTCLISLTISDVVFLLITTATYAAQFLEDISQNWIYGDLPCTLFPFFQTLSVLSNSITLTVIALDRYMAVIRIVKGIWEPRQAFCNTCAVLIWGLACGVSSPMIGMYRYMKVYLIAKPENENDFDGDADVTDSPFIYVCAHDKKENAILLGALFLFIFLPLLVAFLWLNSVIAREVWNRRHPIDQQSKKLEKREQKSSSSDDPNGGSSQDTTSTNGSKSSKGSTKKTAMSSENISPSILMRKRRQVRMFKVILIIMIVFFICRTPQWIFTLIKLNIESTTGLYWILHYCLGFLSMMNCVLNPLLYTFLNETLKMTEQLSIGCENIRKFFENIYYKISNRDQSVTGKMEDNGGVYMGY